MRIITFLLSNIFFLVSPALVLAQTCRSEVAGHCVMLAAASQIAQGFFSLSAAVTPGDLLENIYIFGLGLVGISALVMLVFGGLKYMTAADNPGQVTSARDTMRNAIFGLVLALVSWLILFTINPDLVQKLNLDYLTPVGKTGVAAPDPGPRCGDGVCPVGYKCVSSPAGPACDDQNSTKGCAFTQCPPDYVPVDNPQYGCICKPPQISTGDQCGSGKCSNSEICVDRPTGKACAPLCNTLSGNQRQCNFGDKGDLAGCRCPGDNPPKDCGLERIWICK